MDSEKLPIRLLLHRNALLEGTLLLYEEAPNDRNQVLIEIHFNDEQISRMDDNFFQALQKLRKELERRDIQIMCNGAAQNVYPSPMQLSMGPGRIAYLLKLGQKAKIAEIIDIFDCQDGLVFVSVEEQETFYKEWEKSKLNINKEGRRIT